MARDATSPTLAVDVGGTFTDAVLVSPAGEVLHGQDPDHPGDQSIGVIAAAKTALAVGGRAGERESIRFVHGMTVTTNATARGRTSPVRRCSRLVASQTSNSSAARTGPVSTASVKTARRQSCRPELRFGVSERCGPEGVIEPLDERRRSRNSNECRERGVESVAVCLLFSFRHPEHELRVGELAAALLPGVHVSLSHAVVGTFREYERCATTVADAASAPLLAGYLTTLTERAHGRRDCRRPK